MSTRFVALSLGIGALLAERRSVQALPADTARVEVFITAAGLDRPATASIAAQRFDDGQAHMLVDRLPEGTVTISATAFRADGSTLATGQTTAQVAAGTVRPVSLVLEIPIPVGSVDLTIDSRPAALPEPLFTIPQASASPAADTSVRR